MLGRCENFPERLFQIEKDLTKTQVAHITHTALFDFGSDKSIIARGGSVNCEITADPRRPGGAGGIGD